MAPQEDFRSKEPTRTLPERVGQLYYAHGLFCSSHPVPVISFAIAIVLLCCYPLLNLPLPGNVPQQLSGNLSLKGFNSSRDAGETQAPRWFTGQPLVYVQQVVIKTAVCPWTNDMVLTDAFRAPLGEVFKLLEIVQNYQHENSSKTLSHLCLHVEAVKMKSDKKLLLPEYNCLVLSPANLWQQNREHYQEDPNLLSTIFSYQNLQRGKISLAEMLFGMNMKDTGIKRYPLRTRQRVLQFAITIVFKNYDAQFLMGLRQKLTSLYPLHQSSDMNDSEVSDMQEILHVYYPGEFNLRELVPLTMTYFMLFLYMYFSVRKIELVKSKVGMAFSAVVTVLASLSMSVGLCFFFGLTLTLNGREIFPYLVVIVGLENVLVLTKSVVSTPTHLDVKIRVAQGLSREGWSITKNLLTEVTILTVGLFTFVPAIQEFCIFAVVGLISDFFLQMLFFSTVLAIDIRRMELSSDSHHRIYYNPSNPSSHNLNRTPLRQFRSPTPGSSVNLGSPSKMRNIVRSKSHPRLNGLCSGISSSTNYPTNIVAPPLNSAPILVKLPKRLRLVHFWARTRIFQRAFMVCMVVWISVIVYNSGIVEHVFQVSSEPPSVSDKSVPEMGSSTAVDDNQDLKPYYYVSPKSAPSSGENVLSSTDRATLLDNIVDLKTLRSLIAAEEGGDTSRTPDILRQLKAEVEDIPRSSDPGDDLARLKHSGFDPWRRLSHHHWPAILSLYNTSVAGRYISILPTIRLSHAVAPELAQALRNLEERVTRHFQWQALAAALDPLDFSDGEISKVSSQHTFLGSDVPFIPSSPMELFLTALLCIISVVVLAYTMVVLYRCVCTRNYAEWRASWAGEREHATDGITQVVMEAVPLILEGHQQEVECLSSDGNLVVSSCLGGQLRVWDSLSGEALATIDRKIYFSGLQRSRSIAAPTTPDPDVEDLPLSDYESGSPPSRGETVGDELSHCHPHKTENSHWELPKLHSAININFTSRSYLEEERYINANPTVNNSENGFDFTSIYQDMYKEFKDSQVLEDVSVVELKRNLKPSNRTSDFTKSSLNSNSELLGANKSNTIQMPRHPENVFSDRFQEQPLNISDPVRTMTRHRKPRSSWDDMSDTGFCVENCDSSSYLSRSESARENIFYPFDDSSVSQFNSRKLLSGSLTQSMENVGQSGFITPEQCDSFNVNKYSSYSSSFNEGNSSTLENSGLSNMSHSKEKPRDITGRGPRHSSCNTNVDNSPTEECSRTRHRSCLSTSSGPLPYSSIERSRLSSYGLQVPPIWCLDCHENLVVIGCANGRLEFWEGSTGKFKCLFEDGSGVGVTAVKIIGNRVVVAKLSGAVDFLELESYSHGRPLDWGFTSYRRTHVRTGSAGSLSDWDTMVSRDSVEEDIQCIRLNTTKAHQQPITVLDSEGGRVLTGSKDHTLKVFRLEDQLPLYTLHGHCGPISCLFIDRISPMMSGSGSQDGLLCVWDLLTGACMYNIQAHDGSVVALTYSASYVISLGTDERLCVWERFQGHLLNTIQVVHTYCSSMVMLTHNLLITSKQGSLVVWDVRTGDPVRVVKLGHSDRCVFVKQILLLRDSIVCDYSNQLRIVRFPLVTDKCE